MKKFNKLFYKLLYCDDNINVISTLEDSFNSTSWEQTFEFNSKDNDESSNGTIERVPISGVTNAVGQ